MYANYFALINWNLKLLLCAKASFSLLPILPVKVGQAVPDDIQNTSSCRVWKLSETRSNSPHNNACGSAMEETVMEVLISRNTMYCRAEQPSKNTNTLLLANAFVLTFALNNMSHWPSFRNPGTCSQFPYFEMSDSSPETRDTSDLIIVTKLVSSPPKLSRAYQCQFSPRH